MLGVTGNDIIETLETGRNKLKDIQGSGRDHVARSHEFINWGADQARMLRYQLASDDIDRLILNRGYDRVLRLSTDEPSSHVNALLDVAIEGTVAEFDAIVAELRCLIDVVSRAGFSGGSHSTEG